ERQKSLVQKGSGFYVGGGHGGGGEAGHGGEPAGAGAGEDRREHPVQLGGGLVQPPGLDQQGGGGGLEEVAGEAAGHGGHDFDAVGHAGGIADHAAENGAGEALRVG